jgi:hypothetical protein
MYGGAIFEVHKMRSKFETSLVVGLDAWAQNLRFVKEHPV